MQVLIVDDVEIIRNGLKASLQGRYPDFTLLEANGVSGAWDIISRNKVDYVITDIKMDDGTGMDLIEMLRHAGYDMPVVIISGFGEFEYARKAIEYEVLGYLLKPVQTARLYELTDKAIAQSHNKANASSITYENSKLKESQKRLAVLHGFQNALLLSSPMPYGDEFDGCFFCAAAVLMNQKSLKNQVYLEEGFLAVKDRLEELMARLEPPVRYWCLRHPTVDYQLLFVFADRTADSLQIRAGDIMRRFAAAAREQLGVELIAGISGPAPAVSWAMYRQALVVPDYEKLDGTSRVFLYHEEVVKKYVLSQQEIQILDQCITKKDSKLLEQVLPQVMKKAYNHNIGDIEVNAITQAISAILSSLSKCMGGVSEEIYKKFQNIDLHTEQYSCADDLNQYITAVLVEVFQNSGVDEAVVDTDIIQQVKQYIDEHISENITVKMLSEKFCVNYSYLSSLFSKHVGMGIAAYCTAGRIQLAQKLLQETQLDISTISQMAGYDDVQYFYRIFKKQIGQTPLSYRINKKNPMK